MAIENKLIIEIANKIKENGGNLYLVGGAIRDELLGIESHDNDYSVTGLSFDEFKEIFPNAHIRGKDFPVFIINDSEFAIARRERKIGLGHNSFDICTDKSITIEEDLLRRDITINAIAKEVLTGKIIDPFSGIDDLNNHIIRAVSNHFIEDPLRAYRVCRFASSFNFDIEENTIKMMNSLKEELLTLSVERVYAEFYRTLLSSRPSIFFKSLKKANILDVHFKEIFDLIGAEQPIEYHPEGDSFNHTMIVLDKVADATKNLVDRRKAEIRFSSLVHDLGKGITPKEEYPHHIGHDINGIDLVKNMGKRLKVPNRMIKCGITSCKEHMRGGIFDKMTPGKKVSFIERINKTILGLDGLQYIVDADNKNNDLNKNQFAKIGYEVINSVNGNSIKEKYKIDLKANFASRIHEERVRYLRNKML